MFSPLQYRLHCKLSLWLVGAPYGHYVRSSFVERMKVDGLNVVVFGLITALVPISMQISFRGELSLRIESGKEGKRKWHLKTRTELSRALRIRGSDSFNISMCHVFFSLLSITNPGRKAHDT